MNNNLKNLLTLFFIALLFIGCRKRREDTQPTITPVTTTPTEGICPTCNFPDTAWASTQTGPKLVFKFKFDSTQARLNSDGTVSTATNDNGRQSPKINYMSATYIELAQNDQTEFAHGLILYRTKLTACGGDSAVTFCKSVVGKEGEVFFSIPLSQVAAGTYKWLRVAIGYQNFQVRVKNISAGITDGTIAAFTASNTFVSKYKMRTAVMTPQYPGNKTQGYWGFYADIFDTALKIEGQAGQTTVVNANGASPTPLSSGVMTGAFYNAGANTEQPLVISGSETQDIIITVSLSTNKSFEWAEKTADGLFQPEIGEFVRDMGVRGMIPKY